MLLTKKETIIPKKLILCDVISCKVILENLKKNLLKNINIEIEISTAEQDNLDSTIYKSDIIIGCTNKANILDINRTHDNCIVLDDSIPHCFDIKQAKEKMSNSNCIFSEAGMLKNNTKIKEYRYSPKALIDIKDNLPGIIWKRDYYEITSCILSAYLTDKFNASPTLGLPEVSTSYEHLKILKKLNFTAADYRLEGNLISNSKQN